MTAYNDQYDAKLFEAWTNWISHDGKSQPVPDETMVKVMYSSGFISPYVRPAGAFQNFIGGRDWWTSSDWVIHIVAYVVI
jgi:hypothetical protein